MRRNHADDRQQAAGPRSVSPPSVAVLAAFVRGAPEAPMRGGRRRTLPALAVAANGFLLTLACARPPVVGPPVGRGPAGAGVAPSPAPVSGAALPAALQTAHFRDATRRVRVVLLAGGADTADRVIADRTEEERIGGGTDPALLLAFRSPPPGPVDDSLVVDARTLAPRTERLRLAATTVTIHYAGRRVTGVVQHGDSAPVPFDVTYADAPFAFNEVESLLRSVPLRAGYRAVVPLFSEVDRAVEHDTVTVLGPEGAGGHAGWRVRFADPVIVEQVVVDPDLRTLRAREITQRRSGRRFRLVAAD